MATHVIELPDYDVSRGVVVLVEEGGSVSVSVGPDGVEILGDRAGLRDLARWCLALADDHAPSGAHVHLDPGTIPLITSSGPLMLARDDEVVDG
jgi:hypothetical protein